MKKYLAIILGVFFVLAFAVSSYAEVSLSGEITHWNWYRDNMSNGNTLDSNLPTATSNQAFSLTRVRLGADIKVSDNVKGMIEMENWGDLEEDFYTWGDRGQASRKPDTVMGLRQAWIQYTGSGLLGIPAGIKMGHQPVILGLGKFLNNTRYGDDAILLFADPNKQVHIGLLTFKVAERSSTTPGAIDADTDVYAALMTYKLDDKNSFGINYTRVNDQDVNAGLRQFQNLMLHGAANAAGLSVKAELDYQFGKLNDAGLKAAGYLLFAELGYKVDPVGIRASYAYGSGDNDATDNKDKSFINFLGPDENVAFIYEYQIGSAAYTIDPITGLPSVGDNRSGLTNTTMYNVGLDFNPMKDLSLALDGYLFRANKVPADVSKKVGTEVDLKAKYNVSKGLTWTILAGYFSPGTFYQDYLDATTGVSKKTATAVRSELTLSF